VGRIARRDSNAFAHYTIDRVTCLPACERPEYDRLVRAGDAAWNPLTGEKALLVESAEETAGARMVVDFAVEEGGFVPAGEHVHDNLSEHFEVLEGRLSYVVNGEERTLGPGEQATVSPGGTHRWWNAGEGEVRARVRIEPALHFQEMILVLWGLCADGHTNAEGRPSPLLGALFATRYRPEIRIRKPPQFVQEILFPPLAALARRRGLERTIERYLNLEAHPSAEAGLGRVPEGIMRRTQ
jgi:mannose-6-phosphate isomerase-like protein (cupin superfamily)